MKVISWEMCCERLIIEAPQCCIDLRSANVCAGNGDRTDGKRTCAAGSYINLTPELEPHMRALFGDCDVLVINDGW